MSINVLITGGAGNLGRCVAEDLTAHGQSVTLFDRVRPGQAPIPWETGLPFVLGDLTDLAHCMRAISLAKATAIVHLGALPGPTELTHAWKRPQRLPEDETMRVNTMGTFYLLDAARRLGVRQVVMASTYYVLGLGNRISNRPFVVEYLPIDERHPCRPEDTYGLSKLLGEEMLQAFSRAYGMCTVALRLMGVTYPHRPAPWLQTGTLLEPQPGQVGGPIGTTHQYVDGRDVAQACRLSLEAQGLEPFEAFYISTDSIHEEETRTLVKRLYPNLRPLARNLQGTEGMITVRKAREKLGYAPQYSWRNGA